MAIKFWDNASAQFNPEFPVQTVRGMAAVDPEGVIELALSKCGRDCTDKERAAYIGETLAFLLSRNNFVISFHPNENPESDATRWRYLKFEDKSPR